MNWPFVSPARFDDMLREKNTQIADRDRLIADLQAERRTLWDKILNAAFCPGERADACKSGAMNSPASAAEGKSPAPIQEEIEEPGSKTQEPGKPHGPVLHRPSHIMRRMDRLAEERWLRKIHPAKAAEDERDGVMAQLDAAHLEAVRNAAAANENSTQPSVLSSKTKPS
jgi:hypothetical protein